MALPWYSQGCGISDINSQTPCRVCPAWGQDICMVRYLVILAVIILLYYAAKSAIRSVINANAGTERKDRLPGDEMVLDPECNTYVVKHRAVSRRIDGKTYYFCTEACAKKYGRKKHE